MTTILEDGALETRVQALLDLVQHPDPVNIERYHHIFCNRDTNFSEVEAIGRLVLDEYSSTLFSSSPDTFAAIDAEVARGHQLADAIERIAFGPSS